MNAISGSIASYERLRGRTYRITIEDGTQFELKFDTERYHHLAGFQHIQDIAYIAQPERGMRRFYSELKNGRISADKIIKSRWFSEIEERLAHFPDIERILQPGEGKIIVDFDMDAAGSVINARYHLFQRSGSVFTGEAVTYSILFIGHDAKSNRYYPATFVVEHSNKYLVNQIFLDCTITVDS